MPATPTNPAEDRLQRFCQAATGRFQVLGVLGRGGMGVVLRARDHAVGRDLAVKVLLGLGPQRAARFAREAQITASLDHPGIVRVHSAGSFAEVPYIAYELVSGESFGGVVREADRARRLELVQQAAQALGHAHAQGVVHRDVKPDNLLVDETGRLKVADFGLATARDVERLTQTRALLGTPGYMAPEQLGSQAQVGPPADVWGLGVVLYECLCDASPFPADTLEEFMVGVARANPRRPRAIDPSISPALERVCLHALRAEPAERYADGAAFAEDLRRAIAGEPLQATPRRVAPRVALGLAALARTGVGFGLAARPAPTRSPDRPAPSATSVSEVAASLPSSVAVVATPTIELERLALGGRQGLTGHAVRDMALVGSELVCLVDPRCDSLATGLRVHMADSGPLIRVYDAERLDLLRSVRPHRQGSGRLAAAPGLVVTAADEPEVKRWRLRDLELLETLPGHVPPVQALALDAAGERLLVVDQAGLRMWQLGERSQELWRRELAGDVRCASLLPDGGLLVICKRAVKGSVWALERWSAEGERLAGQPAPICWRISVHPDGTRALTFQWQPAEILVWTLGQGGEALKLELRGSVWADTANEVVPDAGWERVFLTTGDGYHWRCDLKHQGGWRYRQVGVGGLFALVTDGARMWSAGADGLIRATDADLESRFPLLESTGVHEGALVGLCDWGLACEFPTHSLVEDRAPGRGQLQRGAFALTSMNPRQVLTALPAPEEGATMLVTTPPDYEHKQQLFAGDLSAVLATPREDVLLVARTDGSIHLQAGTHNVWRELRAATETPASSGRRPGTDVPWTPQVLSLASDPSGRWAYAAGEEDELLRWDLEALAADTAPIRSIALTGHTPPVLSLLATAERVFAGEKGGDVSVFSLEWARHELRLPGDSPVMALHRLPEGWLLVAYLDGRVRLWDVAGGELLGEGRVPDHDFVRSFGVRGGGLQVGTQLGRCYALLLPGD